MTETGVLQNRNGQLKSDESSGSDVILNKKGIQMADLRIRPIDHLVLPYWQAHNTLSEGSVEGFSIGFRTAVHLHRLQSEAEVLGYNLFDETVRQLQADTDASEELK